MVLIYRYNRDTDRQMGRQINGWEALQFALLMRNKSAPEILLNFTSLIIACNNYSIQESFLRQ